MHICKVTHAVLFLLFFLAYHIDPDQQYLGGKRSASPHTTFTPTPVKYSLKFNLNMQNERMFSSAELVVRKVMIYPPPRVELTEFETVQVELVYKQYSFDPILKTVLLNELREIVDTKLIKTESDEFITFDVTRGIERWFIMSGKSSGSIQFDIVIKVPELMNSFKKLPPLVRFIESDQLQDPEENSTARLVISLVNPEELFDASSVNGRRRRQTTSIVLDSEYCFENPNESNCCVRELSIDFEEDLKWTWIISPKVYFPNYCTGLCPFFWPRASDSTFLLQKFRSFNPTGAVEPCCAPDVLKPILLMFVINDEPFLQIMDNMVVDSCICR